MLKLRLSASKAVRFPVGDTRLAYIALILKIKLAFIRLLVWHWQNRPHLRLIFVFLNNSRCI